MTTLGWIIASTFVISLLAWIGILTLYLNDELLDRILLVLVALAAGSLLGGAFIHLLPRAIEAYDGDDTLPLFLVLLAGFSLFYVLEQFIHWHHHHSASHEHEPVTYLVLVSDSLHNFIDGLVLAGAFLLGVDVGLVAAAAIALHEIPQEIGDFGVLVYGGFDRLQALALNYLTQATVILGGIVGFYLSDLVAGTPALLLAFAAGNFVYIGSSDLIPEIKDEDDVTRSVIYFGVFLLGVGLMLAIKLIRHGLG